MRYKIGQRVKIIGNAYWSKEAKKDIGKNATIVDVDGSNYYKILVDNSVLPPAKADNIEFSWYVSSKSIQPINYQMQFDFMLEK